MSGEEEKVKLRDYQLEIFDKIKGQRRSIIFLPTGSGKTYIAWWLIKSMAADLERSVDGGGKRTFFLVNTAQLVQQQGDFLSKLGNLHVVPLTGDSSGIDSFNINHWRSMEKTFQVFVMTTQVYLDAIDRAFLKLENANLIVFDECHHATSNHPMAQVMKRVLSLSDEKQPKILGLSATLLNANVDNCLDIKLKELETIFDGKIVTSERCKEIRESYSAKPRELIKHFSKYKVPEIVLKTLENLCEEGRQILSVVVLKENKGLSSNRKDEIQLHKPGQNRSKLLQNVLKDILVHVEEYGLYMGFECSQCYIVQLRRYASVSSDSRYITFILYVLNLTQMMRKVLYTAMMELGNGNDLKTNKLVLNTSCEKVIYVLDRLRSIKSSDRCILFVRRKMTAKSLYRIIKTTFEEPSDRSVVVDFLVGRDTNPLRNTKEGFDDKRKPEKILENFRAGLINILIATDVLEEGFDMQECNIVIMFDPIQTFRSYVQSKGRARLKGGEYIILNDDGDAVESQIDGFKQTDEMLNQVADQTSTLSVDSEAVSGSEYFEEYKTSKGATVTNVSAVSKIYLYCAILARDLSVDSVPYWFYDRKNGTCKLQLPKNSGIRAFVQGPKRPNQKEAMQAVALETVKRLHKLGKLNDHLIPVKT